MSSPPLASAPAPARVPWTAVIVFVVLACALAWAVASPLWFGDGLLSPWFAVIAPAMMLTPTIAALVVTFVFRTPARGDRLVFLGLRPFRPLGRFFGFLAIALFAPIVLVVATTFLAAAVGLVDLDLAGFSGFAAQLAAAAPAGTPMPPVGVLVVIQLVSIPVGAILNSVLAFGEELGWRGWLLAALRPLGVWPALLVSGAVWGLWHAPLILLGYNFSRPDAIGLALMVGGCVAWGVFFGWLRMQGGTVWPAVLAHGSLNAAAGFVLVVVAAGPLPDLGIVGPLGVVSWVVLTVVAVGLTLTGRMRWREPRPAAPAPVEVAPAG